MYRFTITLILSIISIFCISAEDIKLIEETKKDTKSTDRPRKPSKIWLICDATDGILTFPTSDQYNSLLVTVECEETGETWEGMIFDGSMTLNYTAKHGLFTIVCVTESNTIFTGNFKQ